MALREGYETRVNPPVASTSAASRVGGNTVFARAFASRAWMLRGRVRVWHMTLRGGSISKLFLHLHRAMKFEGFILKFIDRTHLSLRRNLTRAIPNSPNLSFRPIHYMYPIRGEDSLQLGTPRAWTLRAFHTLLFWLIPHTTHTS
eukprot:1177715-Prorocentrum_minimum.AAC.2